MFEKTGQGNYIEVKSYDTFQSTIQYLFERKNRRLNLLHNYTWNPFVSAYRVWFNCIRDALWIFNYSWIKRSRPRPALIQEFDWYFHLDNDRYFWQLKIVHKNNFLKYKKTCRVKQVFFFNHTHRDTMSKYKSVNQIEDNLNMHSNMKLNLLTSFQWHSKSVNQIKINNLFIIVRIIFGLPSLNVCRGYHSYL